MDLKKKLLRLLLKITEVTTVHQKGLKVGPNSFTKKIFARRANKKASVEGLGRRPKPSAGARKGPRSGPHLLVIFIMAP